MNARQIKVTRELVAALHDAEAAVNANAGDHDWLPTPALQAGEDLVAELDRRLDASTVQAVGEWRRSPWGDVEKVTVRRVDGEAMTWSEVHAAFAERYPGRWAFELFPPADQLVDEVNKYHLWVLPEDADVGNLNINFSARNDR